MIYRDLLSHAGSVSGPYLQLALQWGKGIQRGIYHRFLHSWADNLAFLVCCSEIFDEVSRISSHPLLISELNLKQALPLVMALCAVVFDVHRLRCINFRQGNYQNYTCAPFIRQACRWLILDVHTLAEQHLVPSALGESCRAGRLILQEDRLGSTF